MLGGYRQDTVAAKDWIVLVHYEQKGVNTVDRAGTIFRKLPPTVALNSFCVVDRAYRMPAYNLKRLLNSEIN